MPGCGFRKRPCTPLLPEPPHIEMLMRSPLSPSPGCTRGRFPSSRCAMGLGPERGASPLAHTRRPWEEGSRLLVRWGGDRIYSPVAARSHERRREKRQPLAHPLFGMLQKADPRLRRR